MRWSLYITETTIRIGLYYIGCTCNTSQQMKKPASLGRSGSTLSGRLLSNLFVPGVISSLCQKPNFSCWAQHITGHEQQYLVKTDILQVINPLSCYKVHPDVSQFFTILDSPDFNHLLGSISPWAHLSNTGSSKFLCLLTTWLKKLLNLAQMISPLPLYVDVALQ